MVTCLFCVLYNCEIKTEDNHGDKRRIDGNGKREN